MFPSLEILQLYVLIVLRMSGIFITAARAMLHIEHTIRLINGCQICQCRGNCAIRLLMINQILFIIHVRIVPC